MTTIQLPRQCDRCRRSLRKAKDVDGWNAIFKTGVVIGLLCPKCQTPAENAEAVINEATTDYRGVDPAGRFWGQPKGVAR